MSPHDAFAAPLARPHFWTLRVQFSVFLALVHVRVSPRLLSGNLFTKESGNIKGSTESWISCRHDPFA